MNIQSAAKESGLTSKTIRYYEQIGLLPSPTRLENGYRDYDENDVSIITFIKKSRDLGFRIEDCKRLLNLYLNPKRASRDVFEVAENHIEMIDEKIKQYKQMRSHLKKMMEDCPDNETSDCSIINDLAKA